MVIDIFITINDTINSLCALTGTGDNLHRMSPDNLENPIAKREVIFSFLFLSAINTIPALLGDSSPTEISYYFSSFDASFRLVGWEYTVSHWESLTTDG